MSKKTIRNILHAIFFLSMFVFVDAEIIATYITIWILIDFFLPKQN